MLLVAACLVLVAAGCGGEEAAEGLVSNIDKARTAASLAQLQTSLVTAAAVQAEAAGAGAEDLVAALQAKDPGSRYTTAVPNGPGIVQVLGGGGGPVMLVSIGAAPSASREPYYVAVWQSGGSTMYYVGRDAPGYEANAPAGSGWSATLPQ